MVHAVVMAGGVGQRLRPETSIIPKALLPVDGVPLLSRLLQRLKSQGVLSISLSVNYLADIFDYYVTRNPVEGLEISICRESKFLGTAGPLSIIPGLPNDFVVINADTLVDVDLGRLVQEHKNTNSAMTVCVYEKSFSIPSGVLELKSDSNEVVSFREKPAHSYFASTGLYVLNRRCLSYIPFSEPYGMDALITTLLLKGERVQAQRIESWVDFGDRNSFLSLGDEKLVYSES